MNRSFKISLLLTGILLTCSMLVAACSPTGAAPAAANTQPPAPTNTAVQNTATLPPTATAVPAVSTATAAPTDIPPTATNAPTAAPALALAQDGLSAWCLQPDTPIEQITAQISDPLNPPAGALLGKTVAGTFEIRNLPSSGCVFTFKFNQPAPAGLKLQVYDQSSSGPWLTTDLQPISGQPDTLMVALRHSMIVAPTWWDVNYRFSIVNASGEELWGDTIGMHRWNIDYCWNGRKPRDVNNPRCPLVQDLHPSDPGYGTPVPTAKPEED